MAVPDVPIDKNIVIRMARDNRHVNNMSFLRTLRKKLNSGRNCGGCGSKRKNKSSYSQADVVQAMRQIVNSTPQQKLRMKELLNYKGRTLRLKYPNADGSKQLIAKF